MQMKDCFFTLGGGQFWEDLFVCQEWRIQRNITSGNIRLLDRWDIIREEGSYGKCLETFNKYAEALELKTFDDQHVVILLHGFSQTRNIFKFMEKELALKGLSTVAVNYPSMQRGIKEHALQLKTLLNNLSGAKSFSVVTFGAGSVVLDSLISNEPEFIKQSSIKSIIKIAPFIKMGSLAKFMMNNQLIGFVFGKMGKELCNYKAEACNYAGINSGILRVKNSPSVENLQKLFGIDNVLDTKSTKSKVLCKSETCKAVFNFLKNANF